MQTTNGVVPTLSDPVFLVDGTTLAILYANPVATEVLELLQAPSPITVSEDSGSVGDKNNGRSEPMITLDTLYPALGDPETRSRIIDLGPDSVIWPLRINIGESPTTETLTIQDALQGDGIRMVRVLQGEHAVLPFAAEILGPFVSQVCHDLNNLFSGVMGSLNLLSEELIEVLGDRSEAASDAQRLMDDAVSATADGAALVRRLLSATGRFALNPKRVNLNELVSGAVVSIGSELPPYLTLKTELDSQSLEIMVDGQYLHSAVAHLISNARRAVEDQGEIIIKTGKVTTLENIRLPELSFLSVTNCAGSDDLTSRWVEPFFSTKQRGYGRGLGLAEVHGFAAKSGGYLSISNQSTQTTVTLFLPIAR